MAYEHHRIAESSGAILGLEKNELVLDGKASFHDPVKFRGSSRYADGWLVVVSGDVRTGPDVNDPRYEKGFFGIRHDDDFPKEVQAFEFAIYVQEPGGTDDRTMKCRMRLTSQKLELNGIPVAFGGGAGDYIGAGRYRLYMQGDGNVVAYDTETSPWTPIWNTGTQR